MSNPILQMLSGNQKKTNSVKDMYNDMIQNNPKFRQFVKECEGKTIEDIAMEYDIDLNLIKKFM